MKKHIPLTNEKCDDILGLIQNGYLGQDVARITNTSESAVSKIKCIYNALHDNNYEAAVKRCQGRKGDPVLSWAIQKLNITIPEDNEQLPIEEPTAEPLAPVVTKTESNEDLVRILANIDERMEKICFYLDTMCKEQNANSDNIYKVVANMNNSVLMEMRKRRNRI